MESAMLPRPTLSHSDPSVSRTSSDPSPNFNRQSHNADEPPRGPTIGAAIRAYVPRGGYLQIHQESAAEQNRWGDTTSSNVYATSRTQDTDTGGNHGGSGRRERSCTAILKAKHVKRRIVSLIVSTIFLILVLSLYLAFAVSDSHLGQELHILLIFMVLILGIVLCHSLIRFSLAVLRGPRPVATNRVPSRAGPNGYAQPMQPIHVTLAGDEEMLAESNGQVREKVAAPPPAYGLWRSSVRLNPDLLHWQRVNNDASHRSKPLSTVEESTSDKPTSPRPPSYTSDNGIDYVVEAQPRSFAHWPVSEGTDRR